VINFETPTLCFIYLYSISTETVCSYVTTTTVHTVCTYFFLPVYYYSTSYILSFTVHTTYSMCVVKSEKQGREKLKNTYSTVRFVGAVTFGWILYASYSSVLMLFSGQYRYSCNVYCCNSNC
jgi:predicted ABC-type exoprotein transport system permease subunit